MTSIRSFISIGLMFAAIFGCSSSHAAVDASVVNPGNQVKKTISIGNFNSVKVSQGIDVIFTQKGNPGTAYIETTEQGNKYLKVEVVGTKLNLFYDTEGERNVNIQGPTTVTVSSPILNSIKVTSSGSLSVTGSLNVNGKLNIVGSSSGSVNLNDVTCSELDISLSSSANVSADNVNGDVEILVSSSASVDLGRVLGTELEVKASSSGQTEIGSFKGDELDIQTSSSGNVSVSSFVGKSLEAEASSSGSVKVTGIECAEIEAQTSSSGRIKLAGKCDNFYAAKRGGGALVSNQLSVRNGFVIK